MPLDLSNLSSDELRSLQAQAQAQIELKERKPGRSRALQDWHAALTRVLRDTVGVTVPPYPVWQKQQPAKNCRPHLELAEALAQRLFIRKPRRVELSSAREFVVAMVVGYINEVFEVPVTTGIVCSNLGNAAAAIDHSFPGYRQSRTTWLAFNSWDTARHAGVL